MVLAGNWTPDDLPLTTVPHTRPLYGWLIDVLVVLVHSPPPHPQVQVQQTPWGHSGHPSFPHTLRQ